MSIADSAYTTEYCRKKIAKLDNHVHIARLRNNRKVFQLVSDERSGRGRPQNYGQKMTLNKPDSFLPSDEEITLPMVSRKGASWTLIIKGWNNLSFRGSRDFKAHQHPFRLIQIIALNENQKSVFKKPLWLAVFGDKQSSLSFEDCVTNYYDRYDIEHYFRFGKQCLRMDSYQTCNTEHEESWWKLCSLCYCQLYLSNTLCQAMPERWERYLPEFKEQGKSKTISAPFAQRGFAKLLRTLKGPAKDPIQRGNPLGRQPGEKVDCRAGKPIRFKQNSAQKYQASISSTLEKQTQDVKPQNISDILKVLGPMLENISMTMEKFCQIAMNAV